MGVGGAEERLEEAEDLQELGGVFNYGLGVGDWGMGDAADLGDLADMGGMEEGDMTDMNALGHDVRENDPPAPAPAPVPRVLPPPNHTAQYRRLFFLRGARSRDKSGSDYGSLWRRDKSGMRRIMSRPLIFRVGCDFCLPCRRKINLRAGNLEN